LILIMNAEDSHVPRLHRGATPNAPGVPAAKHRSLGAWQEVSTATLASPRRGARTASAPTRPTSCGYCPGSLPVGTMTALTPRRSPRTRSREEPRKAVDRRELNHSEVL
jgi:hypothetical protein